MKQINLSETVMVSDPCYEVGTWCQYKLHDVLPGEYQTDVLKYDAGGWGERNAALVAIHKDYSQEDLSWRTVTAADIGVDSGQAGIFSMDSFRKDEIFMNEVSEFNKKYQGWKDDGGEQWYGHMCDRTLSPEQWGVYATGVVATSGFGDGSYRLLVAKKDGKVVGIGIDFLVLKLKAGDFNNIIHPELVS